MVRAVKEKKGKKVDRTQSRVPDPAKWDGAEAQTPPVQTLWKPEKMKKLTYTQFWIRVREGKIDNVRAASCRRLALSAVLWDASCWVHEASVSQRPVQLDWVAGSPPAYGARRGFLA